MEGCCSEVQKGSGAAKKTDAFFRIRSRGRGATPNEKDVLGTVPEREKIESREKGARCWKTSDSHGRQERLTYLNCLTEKVLGGKKVLGRRVFV